MFLLFQDGNKTPEELDYLYTPNSRCLLQELGRDRWRAGMFSKHRRCFRSGKRKRKKKHNLWLRKIKQIIHGKNKIKKSRTPHFNFFPICKNQMTKDATNKEHIYHNYCFNALSGVLVKFSFWTSVLKLFGKTRNLHNLKMCPLFYWTISALILFQYWWFWRTLKAFCSF